jgi:hypothetical protein
MAIGNAVAVTFEVCGLLRFVRHAVDWDCTAFRQSRNSGRPE